LGAVANGGPIPSSGVRLRPRGRRWRWGGTEHRPPRELVNDTPDWLREWADEHTLDLGPAVNLPQWDGKTPDYNAAVGWLLEAG
jgi:hypothetical protein